MRAFETLTGWRVVADPAQIDDLGVGASTIIRLAPDDALVLSATEPQAADEHAIIEADTGWSGTWMTLDAFDRTVRPLIEWSVASDGLSQGLVTGVPAKIVCEGGLVLIACATPYVHELIERLP